MLRYKGVLHLKGSERKVIFQGVHQLMGSDLGPKWAPGEKKTSKMVFIGIDLPKDILLQGLEQCVVLSSNSRAQAGCGSRRPNATAWRPTSVATIRALEGADPDAPQGPRDGAAETPAIPEIRGEETAIEQDAGQDCSGRHDRRSLPNTCPPRPAAAPAPSPPQARGSRNSRRRRPQARRRARRARRPGRQPSRCPRPRR